MARHPSDEEVRNGVPGPNTQQLPSISHFLSGIHPAERSYELPRLRESNVYSAQRRLSQVSHSVQLPIKQSGGTLASHTFDNKFVLPPISQAPLEPIKQQQSPSKAQYNPLTDGRPPRPSSSPTAGKPKGSSPSQKIAKETHLQKQGSSYLYDNGSPYPKAVDDDAVNPNWGTTKAGKPRKRLGQACNSCRTKKIRCFPQASKCAQCERFGRECTFDTNIRTSHRGSSSSARASPTTSHDRQGSGASTDTVSEQRGDSGPSSINVDTLLSPSSIVVSDDAPVEKRRRISPPSKLEPKENFVPSTRVLKESSETSHHNSRMEPSYSEEVDPMHVDRRQVMCFVHQFLNSELFRMLRVLPTSGVRSWVENGSKKKGSELAILYAILAFGAIAAKDDTSRVEDGRLFASIARRIQARRPATSEFLCALVSLILCYQALCDGDAEMANELGREAFRMCLEFGINTENGIDQCIVQQMARNEPQTLLSDIATRKESMRRTFWSAYITTRFVQLAPSQVDRNQELTCAIQLPCSDEAFEIGRSVPLPVFHYSKAVKGRMITSAKPGSIALLVDMTVLLDDILDFHDQALHRTAYGGFIQSTEKRLHDLDWKLMELLPNRVEQDAVPSPNTPVQPSGAAKPCVTKDNGLRILYHFVAVLLYRHIRWGQLASKQQRYHVMEMHKHARKLLELFHGVDSDGKRPFSRAVKAWPSTAQAVCMAVDVITSAGPTFGIMEHQNDSQGRDLRELISMAITVLEDVSRHWKTAEPLLKIAQARFQSMLSPRKQEKMGMRKAFFYRKPLQDLYGQEQDIAYGLPRLEYIGALGWGLGIRGEEDMMDMDAEATLDFNDYS